MDADTVWASWLFLMTSTHILESENTITHETAELFRNHLMNIKTPICDWIEAKENE